MARPVLEEVALAQVGEERGDVGGGPLSSIPYVATSAAVSSDSVHGSAKRSHSTRPLPFSLR